MINSKYKSNRYDQSSTYALTLHEVLGAAGLNFKPYAAWRRALLPMPPPTRLARRSLHEAHQYPTPHPLHTALLRVKGGNRPM